MKSRNRPGGRFVAALPPGYDERTRMAVFGEHIIVAHPDHPPVLHKNHTVSCEGCRYRKKRLRGNMLRWFCSLYKRHATVRCADYCKASITW